MPRSLAADRWEIPFSFHSSVREREKSEHILLTPHKKQYV